MSMKYPQEVAAEDAAAVFSLLLLSATRSVPEMSEKWIVTNAVTALKL